MGSGSDADRSRPERPGEPLGIVAGGGALPRIVAAAARENGWHPIVVRIADALDEDWTGFDGGGFAWGRIGEAIAYMKGRGVRRLVWCGTVSRRPDFCSLLPSLATLRRVPAALRIVRGGDDGLLRGLAAYLGREGFTVLPVQAVVPRLLTPAGPLTETRPTGAHRQALDLAHRAASLLGELDAGQAAVASADRVVALEGAEGTREMLARVADLNRRGKLPRKGALALVKALKPGQDHRFDLPSIGVATIEEAGDAGIGAVGLTAGASFVIAREDVVHAADRAGIAIIGLKDHDRGQEDAACP